MVGSRRKLPSGGFRLSVFLRIMQLPASKKASRKSSPLGTASGLFIRKAEAVTVPNRALERFVLYIKPKLLWLLSCFLLAIGVMFCTDGEEGWVRAWLSTGTGMQVSRHLIRADSSSLSPSVSCNGAVFTSGLLYNPQPVTMKLHMFQNKALSNILCQEVRMPKCCSITFRLFDFTMNKYASYVSFWTT